jgi:hypothetical protein
LREYIIDLTIPLSGDRVFPLYRRGIRNWDAEFIIRKNFLIVRH